MSLAGAWAVVGLFVQLGQAEIVGVVRDASRGTPIPGAVVRSVDDGSAVETDPGGRYRLAGVSAGPRHLRVEAFGYRPRTLHALVPGHGTLVIDLSLQSAPIPLEGVEVRPRAALPESGAEVGAMGRPDRRVSAAAVHDHPLLAEPDPLAALAGGDVVIDPELPAGLHVRGGSADQTAYELDGVPILTPYHAAGVVGAWNPDALAGVALFSTTPSPASPAALAGVIAGDTRVPGPEALSRGSVGTRQVRATVDGPVPGLGGGGLVSVRTGFPGFIVPASESSYLRSETGDALAAFRFPWAGGEVRLLGYSSENEVGAAVATAGESGAPDLRNAFEWTSRSLGAGWRSTGSDGWEVRAWRAEAGAGATWHDGSGERRLWNRRVDHGGLVQRSWTGAETRGAMGLRLDRSATRYRIRTVGDPMASVDLALGTPVWTAFGEWTGPVGRRGEMDVSGALIAAADRVFFAPRLRVRRSFLSRVTVDAAWTRAHQFLQSLRNPESVVGTLFPADLYVGAAAGSFIPVARADQAVLGAEFAVRSELRTRVTAWDRRMVGLALPAVTEGLPFATGAVGAGRGRVRGVALDATLEGARVGVLARWAWQSLDLTGSEVEFTPQHGARHRAEVGINVFPTASTSLRLGLQTAFGRSGTALAGPVEWEACNLLDQGCEFAGSPRTDPAALGAAALPGYARLDAGLRTHWHLQWRGRDARVELFASFTNVLGRRNVVARIVDVATGEERVLGAPPFAPLSIGLDWRF